MKAFYIKTIASCLSMIILFLTIGPAAAEAANNSTLEIRGPVYNGSDINDILAKGGVTGVTMDASQFPALYDIDNNVKNEILTIKED